MQNFLTGGKNPFRQKQNMDYKITNKTKQYYTLFVGLCKKNVEMDEK